MDRFYAGRKSADAILGAQITSFAADLNQRIIGSYRNNPIPGIRLITCG